MDLVASPTNAAQLPNNNFRNDSQSQSDRTSWEYHTVAITRVPGYGFGIAVSGGRDNPHFANGDPSIAVSDVLKGGPAEDRLQVNDRIISVNGVSLENVEYATAVQVLRDSGNTVTLVIKRRVPNLNLNSSQQHSHNMNAVATGVAGPPPAPVPGQPIKVVLTKNSKKEDFGIVLGCRLFIKEITSRARDQLAANGYSLQEGDVITRINNTNCSDSMSMKEAKKIIDGCKERLNLVVLRDVTNQNISNNNLNNSGHQTSLYSHAQQLSGCSNNLDEAYLNGGASYSSQNLYVQPPTRGAAAPLTDEKNNLTPRGRSRGPLTDVTLSQLDRPSTPPTGNSPRRQPNAEDPPRPPPPRNEEFYSSRRQLYEDDPLQRSRQSAEPRFISFQKEGSVGIRLTGGNEAGIFVTAVQPGSPASLQGLTPGDKILKVNDMDMHGVTREEAVLFLLSLQDRIDLIVQHCKEEYDEVVANQRGDSFHIKTHFHCEHPSKGEMPFKAGDVFRVIDTLHNGVVGSWQVLKIGRGHQEMQRGVIPNKSRAEELATAQFNATKKEMNASESRGNFFRRRRSTHRRSKSLSRENWDDVVFSDSISKFAAYERVVLRHPGFVRPVVIFGPTADLAREKLTKDFPDKFTAPLQDDDKSNSKCRIVRLSNIRDIMDRGKHALLDITPNAVDRLNYAQFYPIVIFLKTDSKHVIKQLRQGVPKSAHKSSKKLLEQCLKLDKVWSHIFSSTIILNDTDSWYRKLRDSIDLQQSGAVWMSESKPVESLSDDFLFPMTTSRLSYASSPESDLELSPGPSTSLSLGNLPQLVKSSSDPSIATNQDNLDRDRDIGEGLPPYAHPYSHSNAASSALRQPIDGKLNFIAPGNVNQLTPENTVNRSHQQQPIYGIHAPDLPPRIDRASKPPGGVAIMSAAVNNQMRNSNSSGTLGRSAQERLFGKQSTVAGADDDNQDYAGRISGNTDSIERNAQNSLDRQRQNNVPSKAGPAQQQAMQNGSYDSVSSYDSYNTSQLTAQNIRLGPNAPDDLKSVPGMNTRVPPGMPPSTDYRDPTMSNRNAVHEHHLQRGFVPPGSGGPNDLNRQSSPGRPLYDVNSPRNIDTRNAHDMRPMNIPQRPSNLGLEGSPRKQIIETKTDYGKYSRNNSASQADYNKSPKTPHIVPSPGANNGNNPPFKPVPPPKPKNYRPPIQSHMGTGHWDNGEQSSPRSPNGFFYPPNSSHYHHGQGIPGSPHNSGGPPHPGYGGHYNTGQQPPYPSSNGYSSGGGGGSHPYSGGSAGGGQYMHRGHHPMGNIPPHHTPERHALDLAGSREQRGSAFELYRKPQIGTAGHHHNLSEMEPPFDRYYHHSNANYTQYPRQYHHNHHPSLMYANHGPDQQLRQRHYPPNYYYDDEDPRSRSEAPPPLPPPLPLPPKTKKRSVLKSPLAAIKNVFMKTTRPLRRMNSMVEPEQRKIKPCLRRQYSLMEQRPSRVHYATENFLPPTPPALLPIDLRRNMVASRHEPFYPQDLNYTYQNLEHEDIYTSRDQKENFDDLYANRALIDLERRQAERSVGGRRIVRRHSMADRTNTQRQHFVSSYEPEDVYQSRQGAYMIQDRRAPGSEVMSRRRFYAESLDEPVYQSRREMHRYHLYQSKKELQERIAQGKKEIEREFTPQSSSNHSTDADERSDREPIYQSRREVKDNGYKTRTQLREQIYQSRREAMESMAEPIYVSKRELKHQPIYECREEGANALASKENETDEKKEGKYESSIEDTLTTSKNSDLQRSDETVIENEQFKRPPLASPELTNQSPVNSADEDEPVTVEDSVPPIEVPSTPRVLRAPYHISNIIKRVAPAPPIAASRTSLETHYTSQGSLPVGPPNASSTPYTSEMSLQQKTAGTAGAVAPTMASPPHEPTTSRGIFDERGGNLVDNIWNVSLSIPPGAIAPGIKQEVYFTVSDPRLSEAVGGPPLDMENGETMLSPLVMCGPQGLEFLVPVTLNIPHCAGRTASLGLALKATDSEKNLQTNWDNIDLPSNAAAHTVSVKVDHF